MDDETLRRMVRTQTANTPASRDACPSPDALQAVVTAPRGDAAQLMILEHVATCAPCRRDIDLLRTAHVAAPAEKRVAIPRWVPLLAAASLLVVAVSIIARTETDTVTRGNSGAQSDIPLLEPTRSAAGLTFRWRAVPQAVSYRLEVSDGAGNLAFSGETADTVLVAPLLSSPGAETALRWAVEARMLDGSVRASATVALRRTP